MDHVAERAITLGMSVDGRPSTIAGTNALKEFPTGFISDVEAVTEIGHQVGAVAERIRGHLDALREADVVSQNVVVEILGRARTPPLDASSPGGRHNRGALEAVAAFRRGDVEHQGLTVR